jgi:hypothetical protein
MIEMWQRLGSLKFSGDFAVIGKTVRMFMFVVPSGGEWRGAD